MRGSQAPEGMGRCPSQRGSVHPDGGCSLFCMFPVVLFLSFLWRLEERLVDTEK